MVRKPKLTKEGVQHLVDKAQEMRRYQRQEYIRSKFDPEKEVFGIKARMVGKEVDMLLASMAVLLKTIPSNGKKKSKK